MDASGLPWKEGITGVFAFVLLKILYDAVYNKIPDGFRSIRAELQVQMERAEVRHDEHRKGQKAIKKALAKLSESFPPLPASSRPRKKRT